MLQRSSGIATLGQCEALYEAQNEAQARGGIVMDGNGETIWRTGFVDLRVCRTPINIWWATGGHYNGQWIAIFNRELIGTDDRDAVARHVLDGVFGQYGDPHVHRFVEWCQRAIDRAMFEQEYPALCALWGIALSTAKARGWPVDESGHLPWTPTHDG